jgi:hypothetical protein
VPEWNARLKDAAGPLRGDMDVQECSYDGCQHPAPRGNTVCKTHQLAEWRARQGPCSVGGCDRQVGADGLCAMHYSRKRRGVTDWAALIPPRMKRGEQCSVEDCTRPVYAKGHCTMHYNRVAVLGHTEPGSAERLKAPAGAGNSDAWSCGVRRRSRGWSLGWGRRGRAGPCRLASRYAGNQSLRR